jgi:uncharacterized protein with PIN domain
MRVLIVADTTLHMLATQQASLKLLLHKIAYAEHASRARSATAKFGQGKAHTANCNLS